MKEIIFTLLGTGAADHLWERIGEADVRGSAGTLINRNILFDYGITGKENLSRAGIAPDELDAIIFTHSHPDHFNPVALKELLVQRKNPLPLAIYGSNELIGIMQDGINCQLHPLKPGDKFTISGMDFTALQANHLLYDPNEFAFHYLIETADGNVLYALDGAGFTKPEWLLIKDKALKLIIIDATMAESGNWRIFEHNDLEMIDHICKTLRKRGMIDDSSKVVLSHLARTLWPPTQEEAEKLAGVYGFTVGYDGLEIRL